MTTVLVTTRQEFDRAIADPAVDAVNIWSTPAAPIDIAADGGKRIHVSGSAIIGAVFGSAIIGSVFGSASIGIVSGSASIESVSGSARIESVSGSASIKSVLGSASIGSVSGSASIGAASGSASIGDVSDSASIGSVSGSASIRSVSDSASIRSVSDWARIGSVFSSASIGIASGTSTIHLYDRATVTAGSHVAVYLHSALATVTGGIVIDLTELDLTDANTWCEYHGVGIITTDGQRFALLYKAVDANLTAGQLYAKPTVYTVGTDVSCVDWCDDLQCGGGLHVSPRPEQARSYAPDPGGRVRYLRVRVPLDQLRPIGADKCKAPTVHVLAEVDAHGRDIEAAS